MRSPSNELVDLDLDPSNAEAGDDYDDQDDDDDPPLGDPFALAIGCDLLSAAPGVPGCWACVRCDCGRAFKLDLLSDGLKPCPGCGTVFSHVLLIAPSDDPEITAAFLDAIHSDSETDPERNANPEQPEQPEELAGPDAPDEADDDVTGYAAGWPAADDE